MVKSWDAFWGLEDLFGGQGGLNSQSPKEVGGKQRSGEVMENAGLASLPHAFHLGIPSLLPYCVPLTSRVLAPGPQVKDPTLAVPGFPHAWPSRVLTSSAHSARPCW